MRSLANASPRMEVLAPLNSPFRGAVLLPNEGAIPS